MAVWEAASVHQPVLLAEVIHWLAPKAGGVYADGNLGLGGHAAAVLEQSGPDGRLLGFDWDQQALELARQRLAVYGRRAILLRRNFTELEASLAELAIDHIDGLLLDLGISSLQLDGSPTVSVQQHPDTGPSGDRARLKYTGYEAPGCLPESAALLNAYGPLNRQVVAHGEQLRPTAAGRGFSFRRDEPLDMRMDNRGATTAADLLAQKSAAELADIFYYYGEERQARRIAARLVEARQQAPITTTARLAELVAAAVPRRFHPSKIHVATRVFQALRIAVNRELENLETILAMAPPLLKTGGRFCVISFHSLEDRLVKRAFAADPRLRVLTSKPVLPGPAELAANPRARSAKLRVAERLPTTTSEQDRLGQGKRSGAGRRGQEKKAGGGRLARSEGGAS